MTLKLYQNLMHQLTEIVDAEVCLMDDSGIVLASTDDKRTGLDYVTLQSVLKSSEQSVLVGGTYYRKVYVKNKLEFIISMNSADPESIKMLSLISINLVNIKSYHDEKFDKGSFIKNVVTDNILSGDIPIKAKELHLIYNASRVTFLIRTEKTADMHAHDIIEGLFPNRVKDFVIILDDENIVLIRELKSSDDKKEIEKTAKTIIDTMSAELMIKAFVGIGTVAENIKELGKSFKEAQMALLVGRIFDNDKSIINYNNLGIGRLIYQIPTNLCELFLKEVVKDGSIDALDTETILTIQKFFENNLNVSETSRQLYVHRNTLVYRLDKIQKITGLDLRNFDDAIIFKVAMLVKKYLDKSSKLI